MRRAQDGGGWVYARVEGRRVQEVGNDGGGGVRDEVSSGRG